ncbi:putative cystine transporter YijE [Saezia sanguinis]|uniref:Putative cystine transporter YijE n=2 Tax=Saezia sanguinis TaxID=1965230 RepID=A0A433SB91_9BURK|nr:putative cystine transporter YijE [Saezia sanguinis]
MGGLLKCQIWSIIGPLLQFFNQFLYDMPSANSPLKAMGPAEWAMLITLSLLWGSSYFFTSVIVKQIPPLTFVTLRVGLASIALLLLLRTLGLKMPHSPRIWGAFLVMGLLNNLVPFSLIAWGQTQLAGGLAAILNATSPLFTVVFAHWLTSDEKITPNKLVGVVIGFLGVAVMIGPDAFSSLGSARLLPQVALLGAAVCYALAGIYGRRFKSLGIPPMVTATAQVTTAALTLLPFALLIEHPWTLPMPSLHVCAAIAASAIFSTALAYVLFFRILSSAGATNVILVTFLVPVSAIILGALILNERLYPRHFIGMAMIGLGLLAINIRGFLLRRK